ncbi:dolichol-phosphate mannosyltransferase [Roseivirga pacifica]|uniref:Dolichol-phosphate mannosyltransferase n=1 Tax=Roseivirga pacifica TaxID=1267423 RepID=A0A1I0RGY3_9BACT|nr:glycosyltransferase family 2 protein [Roseivirga pacifica]RKQ49610.1 dolichol-phosphate mannosyltransferase [Roseivirga pacifica]SEW40163.1 dolichol-phosphate mannosyltransferase [Roseivirga pacifica]
MNTPHINIVIPLYNEEEVFQQLIDRLTALMESFDKSIEVILVDDGSRDATAQLMADLALKDSRFQSIVLSRNFGHQTALTAGLQQVSATDAVLIIDADLQDPPELLDKLYQYYEDGYDVVYAVRKNRKEGFLKKLAYKSFYRLMDKISYIQIPLDTGDFSLISAKVANLLNEMPEESRFLRGMRSWLGFKQIGIEYDREERKSGESKYSLRKLFQLAFNGVFNFSEAPIKLITNLGLLTVISSFAYLGYVIAKKLIYGNVPEGFTGLLFVLVLFGGIQLLSLGLIGEYVLRIFFQVKQRPLFVIKEKIKNGKIKGKD